ncbi:IS3 family transposase, partial [uncultured Duncaniella sp.]|uniref:IS3 family transposase n=2 Tax=uncultured Duncaniella sp. TaxID=2768039 RepID=UPI002658AE0F
NCTPKVRQKTFGVLFMKYSYEQRLVIEEYIDYYNNKRSKSRLKGKSPVQYRTLSF